MIDYLLEKGVDPSIKDVTGRTALDIAKFLKKEVTFYLNPYPSTKNEIIEILKKDKKKFQLLKEEDKMDKEIEWLSKGYRFLISNLHFTNCQVNFQFE